MLLGSLRQSWHINILGLFPLNLLVSVRMLVLTILTYLMLSMLNRRGMLKKRFPIEDLELDECSLLLYPTVNIFSFLTNAHPFIFQVFVRALYEA